MNTKIDAKLLGKRAGRRVVAIGLASIFSPALAATTPVTKTVFEKPIQDESLAAHFDVNRELGRAWIDVEVTRTNGQLRDPEVTPRALDGLYYDSASRQLIYRDGTERIVCAEDSHFLWTTALKETGQCRLLVSRETRKIDDGFNGRKETVGSVVFEAAPLGPAE